MNSKSLLLSFITSLSFTCAASAEVDSSQSVAGTDILISSSTVGTVETAPTYTADFEGPDYTAGVLVSDPEWNFDADALTVEVDATDAASGLQSLSLTGASTFDYDSAALVTPLQILWLDVNLQPAYASIEDLPLSFGVDRTAVNSFVQIDAATGELYAVDGDGLGGGQWLATGSTTSLNAGAAEDWLRLTYRLDYSTSTWDIFVDGEMVAVDLGFLDATAAYFKQFTLRGDESVASGLDSFLLSANNPLYADTSGDGLPDSWLLSHGLDVNINQRSLDPDADGLTTLMEYLHATLPTNADSDGDGLMDGDELFFGLDPLAQDVNGAVGLARRDVWTDLVGNTISDLTSYSKFPMNPDQQLWVQHLDLHAEESLGNHYAQRIYGAIIAPETADYTFWIAGNDACEFWLSSDASSFNKVKVAYLDSMSKSKEWDFAPSQKSAVISLQAGQSYFFEILHKEGTGNDHVALAWQYGSNARAVIEGAHLSVHTPDANDADMDGLPDDWELAYGLDASKGYGVHGFVGDINVDGRLNYQERLLGTDPQNPNSDGDEFSNVIENKILGSDPLVAESHDYYLPIVDFNLVSVNGYTGEEAVAYQAADNPLNFFIGGGGSGLKAIKDSGQFLNQLVSGDFSVTLQLNRASDGGDMKLALVARESLSKGSRYVGLDSWSNGSAYRFYQRISEGGERNELKLNFREIAIGERWLRLQRSGNTFFAYASKDGMSWVFAGSHTLHLPDEVYLGAFLCSGSKSIFRGAELTFTEWNTDSDRDGLWDAVETQLGTDLDDPDTDGDGFTDYEEHVHLGTDPLVADVFSLSAPVAQASGDASQPLEGSWRTNEDGSIVALDYRGNLQFSLDLQDSGFYRADIVIREGNPYRDASQFRLLVHVDGVYAGESLVSATPDQAETVSFWLPWQPAGAPELVLEWIPVEEGASLRVDSISFVELEFDDSAAADAWELSQLQDEFDLPAAGTVLSPVSPYNLYGQAANLERVSILRDEDSQSFAPQRALTRTFAVDLPLKAKAAADAYSVSSHGGAFTESLQIEWQVTNLADIGNLETPHIRPADSLLLGWSDAQGVKPNVGVYLELFKVDAVVELPETDERGAYVTASEEPVDTVALEAFLDAGIDGPWDFAAATRSTHQDGLNVPFTSTARVNQDHAGAPSGVVLVDGFGLKGDEVAAVRFDVPGTYLVRSTWREADGFVYESILEVQVVDIELGGSIAAIVDYERVWSPTRLNEQVELETDLSITLTELIDSDPRQFYLKASQPLSGRVIARLPGTGAIADVVDVSAISDYSRLFGGSHRVIETFADGTELLEFTLALGGDLPDDFRIHLTPISAGVLFENGSIEQWITADQLDELGRYRFRLTKPGDVPSNGCHYYQFFQADVAINDKI